METGWITILICILGVGIWIAYRRVKADIFAMTQKGNETSLYIRAVESYVIEINEEIKEIKEILTEASRIKALREHGKPQEPEVRQSVRGKRFVGLSERRRAAELESMKETTKQAMVHNNDVRAMEGK